MSATVKQLRAFIAVARTHSLAEASAQLHISQPALSVAIRNLESAAGGPLFNRDSRQLVLTPEGREFLTRAEQLLHNWDQSLDAIQQRFRLQRGQLSLAVIPAFALNRLPALLAEFHRLHPQVNFALEDIVMERVIQAVQEGRAELGISFRPDDLEGLEFIPCDRDRFVAVLPPDHPLAGRKSLRWSDLATAPFIAMNRGSAVRRWTDEAFTQCGKPARLLCEANQLSTIGQLVKVGLGVSAVPSLCEPQMHDQGLKCLPLTTPVVAQEVGILAKGLGGLSATARAFLALVAADTGTA
ncbi:LysR family transcriptional regulator, carnitine catabolism transcriptional activator [Microbulbifer donghaiensis]|uniref:LysR family transcriptional regulator, carnitine catabolism transcriptional activator n=1 Tax=Microbulbifer donghaiensis TaxID=494016 RepID=A0A1M5H5B3_9GAMM|nr:LysR family transcriptional regulator [Microbulbifer donghaiensis]SHG11073.1 LysR family transcriptional regulator, carnitine catabolism transcriptional activator [Microbulbifer donghaiensis]